jgi:vitamin-K-epoxide reductase (warfarin-sensitive)
MIGRNNLILVVTNKKERYRYCFKQSYSSASITIMFLSLLSITGLIITGYAVYVERKGIANSFCDVSDSISCTRVLTSPYAKMMGRTLGLSKDHPLNIPNTYYGMCFYALILGWSIWPVIPVQLMIVASLLSIAASFALAYILYFKLQDFCIICAASYVVNFTILVVLWQLDTSV